MDPNQFSRFQRLTLDYFDKLSPEGAEKPALEEPYLLFGDPLVGDYTGLVRIAGPYQGCIYITAPAATIREVLRLHGDENFAEINLQGMSRELSKILAGNATQALGGQWKVSAPESITRADFGKLDLPEATFIMPLNWQGTQAHIVVGLLSPEAAGAAKSA